MSNFPADGSVEGNGVAAASVAAGASLVAGAGSAMASNCSFANCCLSGADGAGTNGAAGGFATVDVSRLPAPCGALTCVAVSPALATSLATGCGFCGAVAATAAGLTGSAALTGAEATGAVEAGAGAVLTGAAGTAGSGTVTGFGDVGVKRNKYLRLIVHLMKLSDSNDVHRSRLTGETDARQVLDLRVPVFNLPVAPGRNLAVLTEAAVRLHLLRSKGEDPAAAFLARHTAFLEAGGHE